MSINTQSASIAVNGATPVVVNLTSGSPNCAAVTGGRTCSLTVSAPIGSDTFSETLYAGTNATGSVLSQGATTASIVAGTANTVSLALDGVIAALKLTLGNASPPEGSALQIPLTVNFNDASGAAIIGSDPFVTPVTLADSDTTKATTLSKTILNSPADAATLTVAYTGAAISPATISATSGSVSAGVVLSPQATPSPTPAPSSFNDYPTFNYDNQRDGFNPNTTQITPSSVANLHLAWQATVGNAGGDFNVQTQPILATEIPNHKAVLFLGGGSGAVDAQDALTGRNLWSTPTGEWTDDCYPGIGTYGVGGTAAYDPATKSLYIVANKNGSANAFGANTMMHLDGASGAVLGSYDFGANQVGPTELNLSHTAVTLNNGIAYAGTGTTCDISSWRGRIAGVNVPAMTPAQTFFTTWDPNNSRGQGAQPWGGGGVWGWGGVTIDFNGNVLAGIGNTDNGISPPRGISPPFVASPQEYSGYGESLLELSGDLTQVVADNHPIAISSYAQNNDLDINGTPVVFKPLGTGCDPMVALQSKQGSLLLYDETRIGNGPLKSYQFAPTTYSDGFLGVTAFSQATGLLYGVIASDQNPTFFPPGLVAINPGCGSPSVAWRAAFGPDSTSEGIPRSVPAVSAGGVVFVATACSGTSGSCSSVGAGGAVWELDASTGAILNGGSPILYTPAAIRAPATIDGNWVYIVDLSGDLYGLTIDSSFPKIAAKMRTPDSRTFNRLSVPPPR